jgi:hypothetical protein
MSRLLGLAFFFFNDTATTEIYTNGSSGSVGSAVAPAAEGPLARSKHAAAAFERAYESSADRVDAIMDGD